ncbi:hypothetical protein OH77DRAFT_1414734 [Trametes cingulata]|nr:hypothetical protein OH77DRAFT_1414734 [Trametes cingulata]
MPIRYVASTSTELSQFLKAHCTNTQVDLVVRNYFASKAPLFSWTKEADEVIKWLRSRTYLLALLRDIQESLPGFQGPAKTVIRGVATRWTSHYLAYRRLLELHKVLLLLADDPRLFLSGNEESHEKTRSMLAIIRNPLFWHALTRYVSMVKQHLEPLAIAANITQSNDCRLDQVLITFGTLFHFFESLEDADESTIKTAVIRSLEMRWSKADQDVFIAAVLLNPYVRMRPFHRLAHIFSPAAIYALFDRLWQRFYPSEPVPATFYNSVTNYLQEREEFAGLSLTKSAIENAAKAQVQCLIVSYMLSFLLIDTGAVQSESSTQSHSRLAGPHNCRSPSPRPPSPCNPYSLDMPDICQLRASL